MGTKKEMSRYAVVTPLVGATDFGMYYLAMLFLPVNVAKGISFVCAGIAGYLFNKHWTFSKHLRSFPEMVRYWLSGLFLLGYNVLANHTILAIWPGALFVALVVASLSTAVLSFVIKKWWVFKGSVPHDRYIQDHGPSLRRV